MSYPVNTVLTRRDPKGDALDEIRVVGGDSKSLSVTSNTEFGEVIRTNAADLRAEYSTGEINLTGDPLVAPAYADPGPTPEEVFAQTTRENPEVRQPNAGERVEAAEKIAAAAEVAVEVEAAGEATTEAVEVTAEPAPVEEPAPAPAAEKPKGRGGRRKAAASE